MNETPPRTQDRIDAVLELHKAGHWPKKIAREMKAAGRPINQGLAPTALSPAANLVFSDKLKSNATTGMP